MIKGLMVYVCKGLMVYLVQSHPQNEMAIQVRYIIKVSDMHRGASVLLAKLSSLLAGIHAKCSFTCIPT